MRGSRKKGARKGGGRPNGAARQPSTPSERQEAADLAQSLKRGGEDLVPATKLAKSWGVPVEVVRGAIAEIEIQPDHVIDGCAYYSPSAARQIKDHLKR
jgi:hypothetical protein